MTHPRLLLRLALLAAGLAGLCARLPAQANPRAVVSPNPKLPAAPKPPAGAPAPDALYLHLLDDQKNPVGGGPTVVVVRVAASGEYLTATPRVAQVGAGYLLTVTLDSIREKKETVPTFRGKPAT